MGLFSRRSAAPVPLLGVSAEQLAHLGRTTYGGESPHPPGFTVAMQQLDGYAQQVLSASGHARPGQPAWATTMDRLVTELAGKAETGGEWAWVGALAITQNLVTEQTAQDPAYLRLVDRALPVLRNDGVAFPAIPEPMLRRWETVHGTSGLGPGKWPSALRTLEVERRELPPTDELVHGGAVMVAQVDGSPHSNTIWIEQRSDSGYQVLTEAPDSETGARKRWEWIGLTAPTYGAILYDLGDRLATPSYWAHDDLAGFFPCRARSRDEMRIEARALA